MSDLLGQADAARDRRDWPGAAALYAQVVGSRPDDSAIWVQFGHALRESGNHAEAETAYARSLALDGSNPDTLLFYGHALRGQGKRERAVAAYANALRLDPGFAPAAQELIALGARDAIPGDGGAEARDWKRVDAAARLFGEGLEAMRDWEATSGYARSSWSRFRKDITLRPPPGPLPTVPAESLIVLVAARRAVPAFLRATLTSLQDQSVRDWHAVVVAVDRTLAHPVTSFAETDARFRLSDSDGWRAAIAERPDAPVVIVNAGTVLHPEALAWLMFALRRTGAATLFTDQDRGAPHVVRGIDHARPRLFGAFDRDFTLRRGSPALVLATRAVFDRAADANAFASSDALGPDLRRRALLLGYEAGPVAHVPRVLATELELPILAAGGPDRADDRAAGRFGDSDTVAPIASAPRSADPIAIVMPTRDNPAVLSRAIETMRGRAADRSRLRFVIIDNRNAAADALALLRTLAAAPDVTIVAMDESFNWSRACNLGAAAAGPDAHLLFANDDIEMLSADWDDTLVQALARDEVGGVGARLLYPDLTVQHAGIVFGMGEGAPEHEGRHAAFDDPGPDDRWIARRTVAAVTGAFLGVRRDRYEAVGGFDEERLFVGHNDIDFCLRLRSRGWRILYEPAIEALHLEGATRGRNVTRAEVMWDLGEQRDLVARWGAALGHDPGVNPHWTRHARPFEGVREPPMHEVLAHIDRTGGTAPWTPTNAAADLGTT